MIALATMAAMPAGFGEDALRDALGATWAVWDDPEVDWDAFDLVVVRSCWDYHARLDEFLAWARRVPRLVNPAPVLAWNTDKRYLAELAGEAGLPVIPTRYVAPGETFEVPVEAGAEYVLKPTVSAGSRDTGRFRAGEDDVEAAVLLGRLHAEGRIAMAQPYVGSVDVRGETALLFAGGELSHAVGKGRILDRGTVSTEGVGASPSIEPREPTQDERALGEAVVGWVSARFGPLAYARVDVVEDDRGTPVVLEVEVTEPSLFLAEVPAAVPAFAAAFQEAASRAS